MVNARFEICKFFSEGRIEDFQESLLEGGKELGSRALLGLPPEGGKSQGSKREGN